MSELMWVRSHVELLLAQVWGCCRVSPDDDGDYLFSADTAAGWVSILEGDQPMVRITAHAAHRLKPSSKLLRELNDVQARCLSASIRLSGDVAVVTQTISPVGLTQPVLEQALDSVRSVAADLGPLLAAMFDGMTPLDSVAADAEADSG